MRCVNGGCSVDCIPFEVGGVQLDLCPSCKGLWLDAGELERLLSRSAGTITKAVGKVSAAVGEGLRGYTRNCPSCSKELAKERFQGDGCWIDRCPDGHGIWLDSGELWVVYEQNRKGPTPDSKLAKVSAGNPLLDFASLALGTLFRPVTQITDALRGKDTRRRDQEF